MGELRKVEAMIDADLLDDMAGAVAAGDYASREDVITAALEAWRRDRDSDHDRLRALIDEGLASGSPVDATDDFFEDVKRRGRQRSLEARIDG